MAAVMSLGLFSRTPNPKSTGGDWFRLFLCSLLASRQR